MCEAGKVGVWLSPEEATVIAHALGLLSSRLEAAAVAHLDAIIAQVEAGVARAQEKPDEEEEPEPDEDEEPEPDPDDTRELELPGSEKGIRQRLEAYSEKEIRNMSRAQLKQIQAEMAELEGKGRVFISR